MAIYYFRCTQFQSHRPFSACSPIIKGNPTNDFLKIKKKKNQPHQKLVSIRNDKKKKKTNAHKRIWRPKNTQHFIYHYNLIER